MRSELVVAKNLTSIVVMGGTALIAIPIVLSYAILREGILAWRGLPANPTQVRLAKVDDNGNNQPMADYLNLTFVSEEEGATLVGRTDMQQVSAREGLIIQLEQAATIEHRSD